MPFFGYINRLRHFSDVFFLASLLTKTKLPSNQVFKEIASMTKNQLIRAHLSWVSQQIEAGQSPGLAMANSGLFPQVVSSQLKQSENTSDFPQVLQDIARQYFFQ